MKNKFTPKNKDPNKKKARHLESLNKPRPGQGIAKKSQRQKNGLPKRNKQQTVSSEDLKIKILNPNASKSLKKTNSLNSSNLPKEKKNSKEFLDQK